jgi:DNA-binding NarL/FixJ family response regulator
MTLRVMVCDDQQLVRAGLRTILEDEPDIEVVGEASDGFEAVRTARRLGPDVVLMDVRMPQLDGIQATRALAGAGVERPLKVIILTTFDLDEYLIEGLRAGARGFLLKDLPSDELVAAVRTVAAGDAVVTPSMTRRLLERIAQRLPPVLQEPPPAAADALTCREVDVLRLVAQGLGNAAIAEALFLSETTVKSHVSHILTKLGLHDRAQLVVFAYESGLVQPRLADEPPPQAREALPR